MKNSANNSSDKLAFVKSINDQIYDVLIDSKKSKKPSDYTKPTNKAMEILFAYYFDTLGEIKTAQDILSYRDFLTEKRKDAALIKREVFNISTDDCLFLATLYSFPYAAISKRDAKRALSILFKALSSAYVYETHKAVDITEDDFISAVGAAAIIAEESAVSAQLKAEAKPLVAEKKELKERKNNEFAAEPKNIGNPETAANT